MNYDTFDHTNSDKLFEPEPLSCIDKCQIYMIFLCCLALTSYLGRVIFVAIKIYEE